MSCNREEVNLLRKNPGALLLKYQSVVEMIVKFHVGSGYIRFEERDDVIQYVNEGFLHKIEKIRRQYNGHSLLRTYCTSILNNLVKEWIREDHETEKEILFEEIDEKAVYIGGELTQIVLDQEFERFEKVLALFQKQRPKLELFLKLYFRIPVGLQDFKKYNPRITAAMVKKISRQFKEGNTLKDREIFDILSSLSEMSETRTQTSDAIRKWIKKRMDEIILLLNGRVERRKYDRETFQILAELFYARDYESNEYKNVHTK